MENLNMDLLYMVDAIPMIAVGLGLYVMFAVA